MRIVSLLRLVASSTLLSRVLGMIRDRATAGLFGLDPVMDAFAFAFRIPNLARRLFGEGALSTVFLPEFTSELESARNGDRTSAWQLASAVFALLAATLTVLVVIGELFLWGVSIWFAGDNGTQLLLGLTAVMLPYALLICLAAQVTAVLHSLGHFKWPALVPVMLNVCLLTTIWWVDPLFEPDRSAQAYALAVCVVISGVLQLGMQLPVLWKLGFRFDPRWSDVWPGIQSICGSVIPVVLGLSITQINTLLDSLIAWTFSAPGDGPHQIPWLPAGMFYPLERGTVSTIYFGERLYHFPLGVFGVALGTVLFPLFSRHAERGDFAKLREDLELGLRLVLAIGLPASAGLVITAEPLTRLLFEHGEFDQLDSARTGRMIGAYGFGVWAYCAIPVLFRASYALRDRVTPLKVGLLAVSLDLILNLSLIWFLAERGLAWSTAISATAQTLVLTLLLQSRLGALDWTRLSRTAARCLIATGVMSGACLVATRLFPTGDGYSERFPALLAPLVVGLGVYALAARVLGIDEFSMLFRREDD